MLRHQLLKQTCIESCRPSKNIAIVVCFSFFDKVAMRLSILINLIFNGCFRRFFNLIYGFSGPLIICLKIFKKTYFLLSAKKQVTQILKIVPI